MDEIEFLQYWLVDLKTQLKVLEARIKALNELKEKRKALK